MCRPQFAERPARSLASPAHPRDRSLRMIAKLLCHPSRTATRAECLDRRGNRLPDFLGAGMVTALQRRREQGIGPDGTDTEVVYHWPQSGEVVAGLTDGRWAESLPAP